MNHHPDDYKALFDKHDGCTGRINDMLMTLQDEAYDLGRKRGKAEADQAVAAALHAARACIQRDRTSLYENYWNPVTKCVDDADGTAGLDEYDQVLAQIDAALSIAGGKA